MAAGRALGVHVADAPTIQTLVFVLSFYLCMAGGILATRRATHIRIDAITPHLPEAFRLRLEGFLMLLSAGVSAFIAKASWEYVSHIRDDAMLIPGLDGTMWQASTWRWPLGVCFSWIALHFLVGGAVRIAGYTAEEAGIAVADADHFTDVMENTQEGLKT